MEVLAAYSIARYPVDVVLTDAHTWHILRLRNKRIIYWADLSTPVALAHLAGYLKQVYNSPATLRTTTSGIGLVGGIYCLICKSGWTVALSLKVGHVTLLKHGIGIIFCSGKQA